MEANRISSLKRDADVFVTFEGDNTVLLQVYLIAITVSKNFEPSFLFFVFQQVAKDLLTQYSSQFGGSKIRAVLHTVVEGIKAKLKAGYGYWERALYRI